MATGSPGHTWQCLETAWVVQLAECVCILLAPSGEAGAGPRPAAVNYPAQGVLSTNLTLGQH